ncbi:MAG: endonuclease/exonuclease/phosphatase family protein [Lewinellaceae bacterium]|nr:endonuclease/exonuclease/phosphatase family protein [Lewinellaceae bacterium]
MTLNIRYDNPADTPNNWDQRKTAMVRMLRHYDPVIFGIQEGLIHQVTYLDSCLTDYTFIGVGRDDGAQKGEFSAIFYDTTQFEVLETSTFWLSETPDVVSIGWDAAMERICTYGLFLNKMSGQQFWVFNTHFDHMGEVARANSASLILTKIRKINAAHLPVALMGDFNSMPEDRPVQALKNGLADAKTITEQPFYGPVGTFSGFTDEVMLRRIDYIFTQKFKVLSYVHIDDRRDDNLFISDHLPVLATLEIMP